MNTNELIFLGLVLLFNLLYLVVLTNRNKKDEEE